MPHHRCGGITYTYYFILFYVTFLLSLNYFTLFYIILLFFYSSITKIDKSQKYNITDQEITFNEVSNIIKFRCGVCHSQNPTFEGFENAPLGLVFDTPQTI